ncbi:hypothetical protein AKO1_005915 [Acrasis kona]|uniref:Cupin type-2 domain-containing protein n=1 Tax=Acrasis kona TaxID=1008807 RepID=A0AAW2YIS9_9EUKA
MSANIVHIEELQDDFVSHGGMTKKVIHRKDDVPHLMQLAQSTWKPGQVATMHSHSDMTEVFIVKSGTAEVELNGCVTTVTKDMVITIPPTVKHEIRNVSQEDVVMVYFGIKH